MTAAFPSYLSLIHISPPEYPEMLEPTVTSLILNIFVVAVLPALLEEMVYRGFIQMCIRDSICALFPGLQYIDSLFLI